MTHILMSRGILHHDHVYPHLNSIIKPKHKVTIIAFSFFNQHVLNEAAYDLLYAPGGEYYQKMVDTFSVYQISEKQITFCHYYHDDHQTLLKKIKDADIIYFPGGAPDLMMNRLIEKDILKTISDLQDKIIVGSSAGAMIQFDQYHISPDHDYHKFEIKEGLRLLSGFGVEVHYRRRKKQKAAIHKMHKIKRHPIFAIPDDAVMVISDGDTKLINAYQLYDHRGVCHHRRKHL